MDGLFTEVASVPTAEDLGARIQVVDDNATWATPFKVLLMIVMWLAFAACAFSLWVNDRAWSAKPWPVSRRCTAPSASGLHGRKLLRWLVFVDPAVVAGVISWCFIGPMTADDGYYAVMSLNDSVAGFVGNYFQLSHQSFVPFVWYWQFLDLWQRVGGRSPYGCACPLPGQR